MSRPRNDQRIRLLLQALRANPRASYRELAEAAQIPSLSSIPFYLAKLEKEGLVVRGPRRQHRSLATHEKAPAITRADGQHNLVLLPKKDADVAERIEAIGKREDKKLGNGVDVVRHYPRHSLKATRVG